MATFAEFIAWPDREEIALVEAEPLFVLEGWTAVGGGSPNTYQVPMPRFVGHASVPGGVYRQVIGVRQNTTELTARTSLALVDANAGSWFWDETAELLYVRTSGAAVDPDTLTAIAARVRLRMATTGLVINRTDGDPLTAVYYHPWLAGDVPELVQELEDILFGIKTTPAGQIVATNGHGFWHQVIAPDGDYVWKNKRMRMLFGGRYRGQSLPYSQYQPIVTMLVEDAACDETSATWALKPLARLTEQTLPITPYFESQYPNLGDGVRGTKKWIGYGRATIRPDLTDTSGFGVWTIADAAFQTLYQVHAVYALPKSEGVRVNLTEGLHYTKNLTACTVTVIDPQFTWQSYDLEVDVTGKPGGARGYLSTFSEIVQDILTVHLGVGSAELDTAAFTAAQAAAPDELGLWIKDPRSVASILATRETGFPSLERSVNGTLQQTRDGKWTCRIWEPQFDAAGAVRLRKEDLVLFRPDPKLETTYAATRVHYDFNHGSQEWGIADATDPRLQALAEVRLEDPLEVHTYLRAQGDAQTLAERYQFVLSHAQVAVAFQERGTVLATANAGDRVLVTHSPAPTATGAFLERACEITRLERRYAPVFTVSGVLEDVDALDQIGRTVGFWMADAAPNWASATPTQRDASGFWTDDDGRADSGDPASANLSRWW